MIKIVFFAALREQLNCSQLSLPANGITTVNQLKSALIEHQAIWQPYIENQSLLSAVNHQMVNGEHMIKAGDEVAFFPPVTGG
jgi:molybdopterin synthase sulfur carrier subunit